MQQRAILGAVLAGVVVFIWGAISHMFLGVGEASLQTFKDEAAVEQALMSNVSEPGIYTIPGMKSGGNAASEAAAMEKMKTGPFLFVSVRRTGMPSMAGPMVKQLLIEIVSGLLFAWLLARTSGLSYITSAVFVAVAALGGTITTSLPFWNWYGFAASFVLSDLVDSGIGWFLGGLVIAKFVQPAKA